VRLYFSGVEGEKPFELWRSFDKKELDIIEKTKKGPCTFSKVKNPFVAGLRQPARSCHNRQAVCPGEDTPSDTATGDGGRVDRTVTAGRTQVAYPWPH
jgi:hypothetical protein